MKFKYFVLGIFFSVIFLLIVNIYVVFNYNEIIKVKPLVNFDDEILRIDERINKIDDDNCREAFIEMSSNIKKTNFKNDITISYYYEVYFSDNIFLDIYRKVEDVCMIAEDNARYSLALAAYSFPSSIKSKYNLKHEVKFKDNNTRQDVLKDEYEIGSYSSKSLELIVINELLDGMKR